MSLVPSTKLWVSVEQRADGGTRWGPDPHILVTAEDEGRKEIYMSVETAKLLQRSLGKAIKRAAA